MKQVLKRICFILAVVLCWKCALLVRATETISTDEDGSSYTLAIAGSEDPELIKAMQATQPEETTAETQPQITEPVIAETVSVEETVPVTEPAEEVPVAEVYEEPEEEAYELPEYLKVPLYFQTDYPDTLYGAGTIANSGCSITSLAMVATYMTGHDYLPDELAWYFGGSAENNMKRLENGSEALQLPFYKSENWHKTLAALHDGKIAIALMDMDSKFTTTQHFIVLTGINEDGKIMVNDPSEPNYSKWDLEQGFITGFEEYEILQGYSGAWIYDKSAMPEEPFIYSEERPDPANTRYPDLYLRPEEEDLLARVIWVEARGESDEGQQAVAEVILNRMMDSNFPDTLQGVIFAEGQFRSIEFLKDAEPEQAQYDAIEKALYGPYILPEEVVHFATYKTTDNFWGQIGGHYFCYDWGYEGE